MGRQMELKTRTGPAKPLAVPPSSLRFARMKTLLALLLSFAVSLSVHAAAAKKAPDGYADDKAEKKEEPKIKGMEVARANGGFLGVEIVNATFKVTFYDKDKKPTAPDAVRAALRWNPKYKSGDERYVLNPDADGLSLSSPKNVRPPYNFKLYITLFKDPAAGESAPGETYVIDFKQ